jgi:thymidylate synthase ThyX
MTATIASDATQADARVRMAAQHVYDAECALRAARQSQVDAWISAAAHKLHESIVEHLSALDEHGWV